MKKKQLNIAIVGLGNIGLYFYSYLKKNQSFKATLGGCIIEKVAHSVIISKER